jgi:protein-S-isoprenylcysteine O-methyltransferase Ste14
MTLKTKWIETLFRVATGSQKIRNFFSPLGALFYGLMVFLFVITAVWLDGRIGMADVLPQALSAVLAIPTIMFAVVMIGWSVFNFLRAKGTPVPINPPPRLVKSGPYAFVRNPMLTGVFALLFGLGFCLRSISLLVVFTPLFILINVWELKAIEEPELIKRLGQEYIEYRNTTPMFFPGFGTASKKKKRELR